MTPVRASLTLAASCAHVDSELATIAATIHATGRQIVIAVTGGGSGAISALVQTPGASRSILDARVPYSHAALVEWLGGSPDQACSQATACAMAMAAWMRATQLAPSADKRWLVGVGLTASLATDRPKLGDHRVHLAVQSAEQTRTTSLVFDKRRPRAEEELIAARLMLVAIAEACGLDSHGARRELAAELHPDEHIVEALLVRRANGRSCYWDLAPQYS